MAGSPVAEALARLRLMTVYGALVSTAIIYGGWHLVAKVAMGHGAPPLIFALYRCAGGTAMMFLALWLFPELGTQKGRKQGMTVFGDFLMPRNGFSRSDEIRFAVLGLLMAANIIGFIFASTKLSALTCSIFQPTIPVVTCLLSALWGVEEVSMKKFGSVLFSVAGAALVIAIGEKTHSDAKYDPVATQIGAAFIMMNVLGAGAYFVLIKGMLKSYSPVHATALSYLHATGIILALALARHQYDLSAWTMGGDHTAWICLAYSAIMTTGLNYSIQAWAIQETSPTTVTAFTTLAPVAAAVISFVAFDQLLSQAQAMGGILIITGLFLNVSSQANDLNKKEDQMPLRHSWKF